MIGILTFHQALNYGAVLQAYALQQQLIKLGFDNLIIDYRCPYLTKQHTIKWSVKNSLNYRAKKKTEHLFHKFINEKMHLTQKVDSCLEQMDSAFDCYIVGSDQVFNPSLTNHDKTYFLEFVKQNNKKNTYSASLGNYRYSDERYFDLLKSFHQLSIRERKNQMYLQETLNRPLEQHIDPVLLDKDTWLSIVDQNKLGKYILVYMIGYQQEVIDAALYRAKKEGLCVYWISDSVRHIQGVKQLKAVSPEAFINYFYHATCVVTNSFHGTAFSVLFNIPFYAAVQREGELNLRIYDLLELVGLSFCTLQSIDESLAIQWESVNQKLQVEQAKAIAYLKKVGRSDENCRE